MEIQIPDYAKEVIDRLENNGYETYVVGGCLRDVFIGKTPYDWDMCTSALPKQTEACFEGYRVIETGIKHGTVTVVVNDEANNPHMIEITTYRIDGVYEDGRHPKKVTFSKNIEEDLSRRDFTVNAMAYSPSRGFVDCFGGLQDIQNGIIRCVRDPRIRFEEDALRIMRCARFSATLGFNVDKITKSIANEMAGNLVCVSKERIFSELFKMFKNAKSSDRLAFTVNGFTGVFSAIFPDIAKCVGFEHKNKHHYLDVWQHTIVALSRSSNDVYVRLALLFHDIGKPVTFTTDDDGVRHFPLHWRASEELTVKALSELKADNYTIKTVRYLVLHHDDNFFSKEGSAEKAKIHIKNHLRKNGNENFQRLLDLRMADASAHYRIFAQQAIERVNSEQNLYDEIIKNNECYSLKQLAVSGKDIIRLGAKSGESVGLVLGILLDNVIEGKLSNDREVLIKYARDYIESKKWLIK